MRNIAFIFSMSCVFFVPARAADAGIATSIMGSNQSPAMTPVEMQAALGRANKLAEELKQAASAVLDAISKVRSKTVPSAPSPRIEALRKLLAEDCRRAVKPESFLEFRNFALQAQTIVTHQVCKAVATKSRAPCDAMSALSYPFVKQRGNAPDSPSLDCRKKAGLRVLLDGVIENSGTASLSAACDIFTVKKTLNIPACCLEMLCGGADACANISAAEERPNAKEMAKCKALLSMRGATSAQACAAPDMKDFSATCREHFNTGACAALAEKLTEVQCEPIVAREIWAQERATSKGNLHSIAMEAFNAKRAEVDALVAKIHKAQEMTAVRDATFKANKARLFKTIASVSATLKNFKTASGQ